MNELLPHELAEINTAAVNIFNAIKKSVNTGDNVDTLPRQAWDELLDDTIAIFSVSSTVDMVTGEAGEFELHMGGEKLKVSAVENADGSVTVTNTAVA